MNYKASKIIELLRPSNPIWQNDDGDPPNWIFRGHRSSKWNLTPAAWRSNQSNPLSELINRLNNRSLWHEERAICDRELHAQAWVHAEQMAINEFRRSAWKLGYRVNEPSKESTLNPVFGIIGLNDAKEIFGEESGSLYQHDVSLAQHYGLPTRMLDWSFNPLIAAYFATSGDDTEDAAVWALDANALNHIYIKELNIQKPIIRMVIPPRSGNPLISAQSGVFTDIEHKWSFEFFIENGEWPSLEKLVEICNQESMNDEDGNLIYDEEHPILRRIIIKKSEISSIREILFLEGVTDESVRPLLDKIADSVCKKINSITFENSF